MAEYRRRLPHFHPDGEHLLSVAPPDVIYATPGYAFAVEDRARIVAYIEENPVSAGLAGTPEGWPW
jgi:hypothetical protein